MSILKYGRFEASYEREYQGNPFSIELNVEIVSPSNRTVCLWGFYDGGNTWRFRFMPEEVGVFKYCASFSDGVSAGCGEFTCVEGDIPGMVAADQTNPMWFGYSSGKHFFMRSFHVGDCFFAENWPEEYRKEFLDWAQKQGYNTLSIASFFVNREEYGRGAGWKTPALWPLNPEEYRKAEKILDDLAERKIIVFPFAGFFGRDAAIPNSYRSQLAYIKYTLARWGSYWNLIFNVAGPEPILDHNPFMSHSQVDMLGLLIQKYDIYHHMLTVHNQTGRDQYPNAEYLDYTTMQGPKTVSLTDLQNGLLGSHKKDKPMYAQETLWTDNMYGHPKYTDDELLRNAYVIAMSAAALNYGDMNGDSSSGFSGRPELERRVQRRHDIVKVVWDNIERFPYYDMCPDKELGMGIYGIADKEHKKCLFFASGIKDVELNIPDGAYTATIINARTNEEGRTTVCNRSLELPDSGDWFVYVQAKE